MINFLLLFFVSWTVSYIRTAVDMCCPGLHSYLSLGVNEEASQSCTFAYTVVLVQLYAPCNADACAPAATAI